jgi:nucleoside-diphosphate-sugar epimerase
MWLPNGGTLRHKHINMSARKHILFFGFGFSAAAMAKRLDRSAWKISGTSRSHEGATHISEQGYEGLVFDALHAVPEDVTHIVTSVPPDATGDPVLNRFHDQLAARAKDFQWLAYLSTTGVYGDHAGGWVDELTALTPNTERGVRRLVAETAWLQLHRDHGLPVHLFRLAGIYGPGRNALMSVKDGTAKRVIRAGQVFSRIHVEDIAGVLLASLHKPYPGRAYNVADDEPCPPQDVIAHAAKLLGVAPPPEIAFEDAALSPMARSFFMDSKRVSNARVKQELGYEFQYPNYREGLKALLAGV